MSPTDSSHEWKERGRGQIQIWQDKTCKKTRILLRDAKTAALRVNMPCMPLELTAQGEHKVTFQAIDYSNKEVEAGEFWFFTVGFRRKESPQARDEFVKIWKQGAEINKQQLTS